MSVFDLEPQERLAVLGDEIMASVIGADEASMTNRKFLYSVFTPNVFRNENHILYKVLYGFKDKNITPNEEFLSLYLSRNLSFITASRDCIDYSAYSNGDERAEVAYISAVLSHYNRLKGMPVLSFENFNVRVEEYRVEYMSEALNESYNKGKTILSDKIDVGGRKEPLQGYYDSAAYVKKAMADIDAIADKTAGLGFIDASVYGLMDDLEVSPELIGDFGEIEELNNHLGGIYSSYFYSILAPTKGGKSKFTSRMIHNILVEHGKSAVVWPHEGGESAWLAQLRAIHFDWYYNRNETDKTKHKTGLSQERILRNDYPTEDIKKLEEVSRVDLFTNPMYGKLILIDRPFKVETFLSEIETARQMCNAQVVLVDYLQLITSDNRSLSKPQALGQAYQAALAYAKKCNVAFISPAQMTQDFMNEMAKSKEGTQHELRTAGGETSEVIRTPDINIALYGSIEDIRNGTMKILSIPSRLCQPFENFDIYCDLAVCRFASLSTD